MLRLLIGTGTLLMVVGFGAAGWQYWQSLPASVTVAGEAAPGGRATDAPVAGVTKQSWLMSSTGDLIPQDEVRTYLEQARFAPSRIVLVTRQASLSDLLAQGETLPEDDYLQVLADIRAPLAAKGLCEVLIQSGATECAVHAARVVEGSVDPVAGTAVFRLELVYRLPDPAEDLPDLAAHVFQSEVIELAFEPGSPEAASPDVTLAAALAAAAEACAAETVGELCRMQRLTLDWTPGQAAQIRAEVAWLDPLPNGLFAAPPLATAPGG